MGSTRTPRGGSPAASIACCDLARGPAHVLTLDVGGQGQVALRHVAVELAGPHAPPNRRHVADHQVDQGVDRLDRQGLDIFRLLHPQGRHLELDQVVEAGLHVDPVVEVGEPGRRRRHDQRMGHVLDRGTAQAPPSRGRCRPRRWGSRASARTATSRRNGIRLISAAIFSACCRTSFRSVPTIRTAIGVAEPKLMTEVTMSPGSKPKVDILACRCASAGDRPPCSSRLASQGITRSGRTLRSRSRNSVELDPAVLASARRAAGRRRARA